MSQHTPGEWTGQGHQRASHAFESLDIESESGRTIASLPDYPNAEDDANARLIAAAPALLEACKLAKSAIESASFDRYAGAALTPAYNAVLQAIAQAEGST